MHSMFISVLVVVVVSAFAPPVFAHPSEAPDSLRAVLDLTIDKKVVDEIVVRPDRVQWATNRVRSVVVLRAGDIVYVYEIGGEGHALQARDLAERVATGELRSIIIEKREIRAEAFTRTFRVQALSFERPVRVD